MSPSHDSPDGALNRLIGEVVGNRYLIKEKLGEGGMGVVYRALQTSVGRSVALKVLHPELCSDASTPARFRAEAEATSRLTHPNTVMIYDFDSTENLFFLAMELVDGTTLSDAMQRQRRFDWRRAVHIARQICGSLQDAHDHRIIHRDLKPDNVMLLNKTAQSDFVKVLDFGIAKIIEGEGTDQRLRLTQTGMIIGTPRYMSPEQIRGERLDHRTDIYSLGVFLYEMLAGRMPFESDSPMGILSKHLIDPAPTLSSVAPEAGIPMQLETLVLSTLAKDRDQRPGSMRALAQELDAAQGMVTSAPTVTLSGGPTTKKRGIPRAALWIPLGFALLALLIGWHFLGGIGDKTLDMDRPILQPLPPPAPPGPQVLPSSGQERPDIQRPAIQQHLTCIVTNNGDPVAEDLASMLISRSKYIEPCVVHEMPQSPIKISFAVPRRSNTLTDLKTSVPTSTQCLVAIIQSEPLRRKTSIAKVGTVRFDFLVGSQTVDECRIDVKVESRPIRKTIARPKEEELPEVDLPELDRDTIKEKLKWLKGKIKNKKPEEPPESP